MTHLFWFDFDPSVFEWEDPAPCLLIASIPAGKNKHNGQVLWILGGAISQVLSGDGTYGPVQKQSSQVVECLNLGWNFKVCVSVLELWVFWFFFKCVTKSGQTSLRRGKGIFHAKAVPHTNVKPTSRNVDGLESFQGEAPKP